MSDGAIRLHEKQELRYKPARLLCERQQWPERPRLVWSNIFAIDLSNGKSPTSLQQTES